MREIIGFYNFSIYLDGDNLILRDDDVNHTPITKEEIVDIYNSTFNGKCIIDKLKKINLDNKTILSFIIKSDLDGFIEYMINKFDYSNDIRINIAEMDNFKSYSYVQNEITFNFFKYNQDILIFCYRYCRHYPQLNEFILTSDGTIIKAFSNSNF